MKSRCLFIFLLLLAVISSQGQDEKSSASEFTSQGMTAYSAGDYPLAIELFKKAFVLRPDYSALAYNIGCCYALSGARDSAIAWLEKTFELGSYLFLEDEDLISLHADERYMELAQMAEQKIEELKNRDWDPLVRLPDGYSVDKVYPVVIGLHGFGTSPVDFAKSIESAVNELGYVFCCPYGPYIGGTTAFGWGECEAAEKRILDAIHYLSQNYRIDENRIILFGFSEGGSMAFCVALKNPETFESIISVAGYYDYESGYSLEHEKLKTMPVVMMIGENDFQVESNRIGESLMKEKGMPVKLVIYPGLGHAFPPNADEEVRKALGWIEKAE